MRAILDKWPSRQAVADDLDVRIRLVYKWVNPAHGRIPSKYHAPLLAAAKRRGIPLTADDFLVREKVADPETS